MWPRLLRALGWGSVAVLGLLAGTVFVLLLMPAKDALLPGRIKYGLVFDAGSTHTSLYIYRWRGDKENGTGIVSQVEACHVSGECAGICPPSPPAVPNTPSTITDPSLSACSGGRNCVPRSHSWSCPDVHHLPAWDAGWALCSSSPASASWAPLTTSVHSFSHSVQLPVPPGPPKGSAQAPEQWGVPTAGAAPCRAQWGLTGTPAEGWGGINGLSASLTCHLWSRPPQAFSGFYYTLHFLNLTEGQPLSLVNASIREICNSTWKQVQELFPSASRTQLRDACTASSYILTLLLQGYKFNYTTWPNIHFVQQVAGTDVGWTLGYMLNLTNMIPSEPPAAVTELPRSLWMAATALLAIMLILTFCLLTAMSCQRSSLGYEQL
ncbi:hypothetical protein HGM15179_014386 [Zosterops borbonicus]|uniref:Ectonucleoside triphosphate diphosphohydrolase 8 n=1 Tax=Zosterops borbonicus TaxID=364589 RepID=A0A8K1LGE9_9PASS|nr:hypothetical protein HGM15179_014386 [Zosterops borbonicus]